MSVTSGPNPVTDSLAAYFDVGSQLCFRGEATTNLMLLESDYTGTAYAPSNEWSGTVLKKIYDPSIITPIGNGATLIMESGGTGWHALSRIGGGDSGNFCISAYIKPYTNDITNISIGLLNDITYTVTFNLNTRAITYGSLSVPRVAFIEDVREYPGWLRIGANVFGRSGGWVGSIGYDVSSYTGSISGKQMYVTGLQYETGVLAPTRYLKPQTTRGTTVATGGGLVDISENDYHADFVNGAGYKKSNGGSITFDGIDDRVSTGNIDLSSTNKITVSFWCRIVSYIETVGGVKIIFEISNNFNSSTFGAVVSYADDSNGIYLSTFPIIVGLKGNNGYNLSGFSKTLVNDLKWHHWACIFDKSLGSIDGIQETILYIDGIERVPSIVPSNTYRINNTNNFGSEPLHIGQRTGNVAPANIEIANFQIYNKVLTANEVKRNFNALRGRFNT